MEGQVSEKTKQNIMYYICLHFFALYYLTTSAKMFLLIVICMTHHHDCMYLGVFSWYSLKNKVVLLFRLLHTFLSWPDTTQNTGVSVFALWMVNGILLGIPIFHSHYRYVVLVMDRVLTQLESQLKKLWLKLNNQLTLTGEVMRKKKKLP